MRIRKKRHVTLSWRLPNANCGFCPAVCPAFLKPPPLVPSPPPSYKQPILSIPRFLLVHLSVSTLNRLTCLAMWKHMTCGKYRLPFTFIGYLRVFPTALSTSRGVSGTQSVHSHEPERRTLRTLSSLKSQVSFCPESFPSFRLFVLSFFHVSFLSTCFNSISSSLTPPVSIFFISQDERCRLYPIFSLSPLHARQ